MPDESHQMQEHKMKFRWRMACIDKSGIDKSGRTVWGRVISGKVYASLVLAALFVAIIGMDSAFIGHKPALACCYDPPEPVIEPDPVAPSAPTSDSQEEVVAPADSATQSKVNAQQDKEESDPLPANLYAPVLRSARLAIEDGQWLKAREIVSQADEKLGPAPEFSAILAKIDRHFGLSELASTSLLPENRAETPFTPVFDGRKNPLKGLIDDFGANAELLRLP